MEPLGMEASGSGIAEKEDEQEECSLLGLPSELVVAILCLVPSQDVLCRFGRASRACHQIVVNNFPWKQRLLLKKIRLHESETSSTRFNAMKVAVSADLAERRFQKLQQHSGLTLNAHQGTVNAMRQFRGPSGERRCLTASRDRQITLWDFDRLIAEKSDGVPTNGIGTRPESLSLMNINDAHNGWIWQVTTPSSSSNFFSCGWDYTVKQWKLTPDSCEELGRINLGAAVVGLEWLDGDEEGGPGHHLLVASSFAQRVCILDVRQRPADHFQLEVVAEHKKHRSAAIGLCVKGNYVYSSGEDRRVILADVRKLRDSIAEISLQENSQQSILEMGTVKEARLPSGYAQPLSVAGSSLVAGTNTGQIVFLHPDNLSLFGSYSVREVRGESALLRQNAQDPVRAMVATQGAVISLSKYGFMDAFSYGTTPSPLMPPINFGGEPTRLDYSHGDIAVALGDGRVILWPTDTAQVLN